MWVREEDLMLGSGRLVEVELERNVGGRGQLLAQAVLQDIQLASLS